MDHPPPNRECVYASSTICRCLSCRPPCYHVRPVLDPLQVIRNNLLGWLPELVPEDPLRQSGEAPAAGASPLA